MAEHQNLTQQKKQEASKAAMLSAFVIPGAGQMYNRHWIKGILIAIVFSISSLSLLIPVSYACIVYILGMSDPSAASFNPAFQDADPFTLLKEQQLSFITLLVVSIVLYVYSILDAYQTRNQL